MSYRVLGAVCICLLVTGCAPVDPGMGEAAKYDMVAQTVNPEPVYQPGGALPGGRGDHAAKADERYRKGAVKALQVMTTASGGSSGGSGGGSSGGGSGPQ